jgi:predicted RNA-binding Zn-ribbon protein involved in translation (DUF1610 family)
MMHYKTCLFHHPDCPLGENGTRAYFEARDALSNLPPEARATDADREAIAIAEHELEATRVCKCGLSASMEEAGTVSSVEFQLVRSACPKCGSKNIEIVWNCSEPEILRYECRDCNEVTREHSPVQRGPR